MSTSKVGNVAGVILGPMGGVSFFLGSTSGVAGFVLCTIAGV